MTETYLVGEIAAAAAEADETVGNAAGGVAPGVASGSASAATGIDEVIAAKTTVLFRVGEVLESRAAWHQEGVDVAEAGGEAMEPRIRFCDIPKVFGR